MATQRAEWQPGRVMARCLGYGIAVGAGLGLLIALLLFLVTAVTAPRAGGPLIAGLFFICAWGLGIGGLVGLPCGFLAGLVLLCAGQPAAVRGTSREGTPDSRRVRVHRTRMSLAAGFGAALLPLAGVAVYALRDSDATYFYLFFAVVCFLLGMLLGPVVAYGPAPRRAGRRQAAPRPGPPDAADLNSAR